MNNVFIYSKVVSFSAILLFSALSLGNGWALTGTPVTPSARLALVPVIESELQSPVYLTHAGDQSGRLFVVEQEGRIRIVEDWQLLRRPFLDITSRVHYGGERGLLGLAFHPEYRNNGRYVVNYTRRRDGATVVAEYQVSKTPTRSQTKEKVLLVVSQPYGNHNGGMVAFGLDGLLYIALGDGGAGGDPGNFGQNREELLGKILRIDLDQGFPYAIPKDNPFVSGGGRPEIFAYGFRNPWRFSFDRKTGKLWAGDVGQNSWEEIDVVERGKNYGWRIMEGRHCFSPETDCAQSGLALPVAEYRNGGSRCSITGGYVYRGRQLPSLVGTYVFGDYCSGEILGLVNGTLETLLSTNLRIASFGEEEAGELYVLGHSGSLHRIVSSSGTAP